MSNGYTLIPERREQAPIFTNIYGVGVTVPAVVTSLNGKHPYKIINAVNSGYAVDVAGSSTANGAVVDQWVYNAGNNQRWTFSNTGNGFYTVKNVNSGLMLEVAGASTSAGALIDQWAANGGLNQLWVIQFDNPADSSGSYDLFSANTGGNMLEVPGSSTTQGTQLDQYGWNDGPNQFWNISAP